MTLVLVHDADADDAAADPCGWVTPDLWRNDVTGQVAVRFTCSRCGAVGAWAFGPATEVTALAAQAKELGPHPA